MFYVLIKRPIYLQGRKQELGEIIKRDYGVNPGIHLVENGKLKGEKGVASYWEFFDLFKTLPILRTQWNDSLMISPGEKKDVTIDLFTKEGLISEESVMVTLHEVQRLSDKEKGKYLLLCSRDNVFIQIIAE